MSESSEKNRPETVEEWEDIAVRLCTALQACLPSKTKDVVEVVNQLETELMTSEGRCGIHTQATLNLGQDGALWIIVPREMEAISGIDFSGCECNEMSLRR